MQHGAWPRFKYTATEDAEVHFLDTLCVAVRMRPPLYPQLGLGHLMLGGCAGRQGIESFEVGKSLCCDRGRGLRLFILQACETVAVAGVVEAG